MDIERCDRLDHLGVVSGFLKESKIIDFVDAKFKEHIAENSNITPGQAVAGMIINGLGFANMPLSLTPDFFKNKAVEQMFGEGVKHQDFNQHKLGRTLDQIFAYGCEKFFYEVASLAHQKYQVDSKFLSLDTTSLSLTGEYNVDTKEHEVKIAIPRITGLILSVEMVCSQDGGVPLMVKCFDGNESDNNIFQQRAQDLIEIFKESEQQKYLVADSKLYSESNAETLKQLQFITRIPATIKLEREAISEALEANNWTQLNKENKYVIKSISHYGIEQRWVVIHSQKAQERSAKTLDKLVEKEQQALVKSIKAIGKQRYHCHNDAQEAAQKIFGKIKYHEMLKVVIAEVDENNSKEDKITKKYAIQDISFAKNPNKIQHTLEQRSCFVLASNIKELTPEELIAGYKGQNNSVEMGFRFLKSPSFFADSLYLKKPSRIMAMITIMVLSLLIYSIAQRQLRNALQKAKETIPNQIKKEHDTPTMKWVFQVLDGITVIYIKDRNSIKKFIHGINNVKKKIISHLGDVVMGVYGLSESMIC